MAENIDMDWIRDEPDSSRPDNMVGKPKWARVNMKGNFIWTAKRLPKILIME